MSERAENFRMPDGSLKEMTRKPHAPSLGRIVLFRPSEGAKPENGAEEYVAIIGQVFSAESERPYCNLLVMPPFAVPYWEGSVQEHEPSAEAPQQRSWRWPPQV